MAKGLVWTIATAAQLLVGTTTLAETAAIRAVPDAVQVSTFFSGETLRVEGTAPAMESLAVVLSGVKGTVDLKRKGRVWGLLWMNVGEISFTEVPSVYMLASSGPVCELAPYETRVRLGMGLDVLGARFAKTHADEDAPRLFSELVKLKQQEGLYTSAEGGLAIRAAPEGGASFSGALSLPASVPEGIYSLNLWGFRDGEGVVLAETAVKVTEVGLMRDIAEFARSNGLLYGVLAVIIALVTGFMTGALFGMVGKGGH
jgi:uncharacterized protein (TIGR02186 family)